jgi:PIN domain nuclease of toxin-antitoxin system
VTVWEIAQLIDKGRIMLDVTPEAWIERLVGLSGVEAVPLTVTAAAAAYRLPELEHRDPGDRLLIATSIDRGCPLVTYDARIAKFSDVFGKRYGLDAVS